MADFRKMLYAFAGVALLAGLTVPASAQVTSCTGQGVNTTVRGEGYTEQVGDIIITCTGGLPTAVNATVPAVTITVFLTSPITSKITDSSTNPAFNEALLIVDDAGTAFDPRIATSGHPLRNCGNAGAPYDANAGPGVCNIIVESANPADTYNGNTSHGTPGQVNDPFFPGHANVFQGRQVSNSSGQAIQFVQVPFDPPGPTNGLGAPPTRTFRITNLRANAASLGVSGSGAFSSTASISANITFAPSNSILLANSGAIQVALVRTGLTASATSDKRLDVASFLQCTANKGSADRDIVISEGPGMQGAFKVRNFKQMFNNGTFAGNSDWAFNGALNAAYVPFYDTTDVVQNVPGVFYATEGGFLGAAGDDASNSIPAGVSGLLNINPPAGNLALSNANGIAGAGKATQGTRIAVKFGVPPAGSAPTVPLFVYLFNSTNTSGCTTPGITLAQNNGVVCRATGVMELVSGSDANGAGGSVVISNINGSPQVAIPAAGGTMVWEVLFSNPGNIDYGVISTQVSPTVALGSAPSTPDTAVGLTANVSFAPFYDAGPAGVAQPDSTAAGIAQVTSSNGYVALPIPRFTSSNANPALMTVYQYSKCACDMLFPWVVGDSTFTTSIVIDNTSLDPCNGVSASKGCATPQFGAAGGGLTAAPQAGAVTFWYYGTKDISLDPTNTVTFGPQTSVSIPAGSYVAHIVSPAAGGDTPANGLKKLAGPFAGYVIAQSQFQYCHGVASISSSIAGFGTQTYVGLILDGSISGSTGRNALTTEKLAH